MTMLPFIILLFQFLFLEVGLVVESEGNECFNKGEETKGKSKKRLWLPDVTLFVVRILFVLPGL